jgi:hypothetical protein
LPPSRDVRLAARPQRSATFVCAELMNVEFRIAKLERMLSNVSLRRARDRRSAHEKSAQTSVAAWDCLERDFRAALCSLKQQGVDAKPAG